MADCVTDAELEKLMAALRGEEVNKLIEIELNNRQEYAVTKKFDLTPKASASAINDYIQKNKILANQIIDFKVTTRQDGMISCILVWGRTNPTIIAGPQGPQGPAGPPGLPGIPGKDGQCQQ